MKIGLIILILMFIGCSKHAGKTCVTEDGTLLEIGSQWGWHWPNERHVLREIKKK